MRPWTYSSASAGALEFSHGRTGVRPRADSSTSADALSAPFFPLVLAALLRRYLVFPPKTGGVNLSLMLFEHGLHGLNGLGLGSSFFCPIVAFICDACRVFLRCVSQIFATQVAFFCHADGKFLPPALRIQRRTERFFFVRLV